jgi:hypothetical protein
LSTAFIDPGQTAGFLGARYEPLWLRPDPKKPEFTFRELELPADSSPDRLRGRDLLLQAMERKVLAGASVDMTTYQARALDLLTSDAVRRALRLDREDPRLRDSYGRNVFGQSCLLARRLIEAGVSLVNIDSVGFDGFPPPLPLSWDTHWDRCQWTRSLTRLRDVNLSGLLCKVRLPNWPLGKVPERAGLGRSRMPDRGHGRRSLRQKILNDGHFADLLAARLVSAKEDADAAKR